MNQIEIYEAFDGKQFERATDCVNYEAQYKKALFMYDENGNPTNDTNSAMFLYFNQTLEERVNFWNGEEWSCAAAKMFINLCKNEEADYDGIEPDSWGFYYYDEGEGKYQYIDVDYLDGMIKAINILKGQGIL